jgi:hypothetical protein
MKKIDQRCICGHTGSSHEHYRAGSDCALCPAGACARFRATNGLRGWIRKKLVARMQRDAINALVAQVRCLVVAYVDRAGLGTAFRL